MLETNRARVRMLAGVVLAAALVAGSANMASAGPAKGPVQKVGRAGFTPIEPKVRTEAAEAAATAGINDCNGNYSLPCLTIGPQYWTGLWKCLAVCSPGQVGPPVTVRVYKRSFATCKAYEAMAVNLCMNGQVIYANGYAACITACTIAGLRGYRNCGTSGTGAFGWSLDQRNCSDSYLDSHASVQRNAVYMCLLKVLPGCDTNSYHVNVYWNGGIFGPYNGEGAYS